VRMYPVSHLARVEDAVDAPAIHEPYRPPTQARRLARLDAPQVLLGDAVKIARDEHTAVRNLGPFSGGRGLDSSGWGPAGQQICNRGSEPRRGATPRPRGGTRPSNRALRVRPAHEHW